MAALQVQADNAQQVFSQYQDALLQVQVVEKQTQHKTSIGSGFYIAPELVITNYHVVASRVATPDSYQLMAKFGDDGLQPLEILALDVVNDLALLKAPARVGHFFALAAALPEQGAEVFSLGNPHDLGMVVVPGTYNGMKQQSFYPRLHVTGSINPGMSGGPSVNELGQVVGVNVSTGGNQLGFVVPMAQVKALVNTKPAEVPAVELLKTQIGQQLLANQQQMLEPLLNANWQMKALGRGLVPESIAPYITCWARTNPPRVEQEIRASAAFCGLSEDVFISHQFTTGKIQMQFEWFDGSALAMTKFVHHYANKLKQMRPDNRASVRDVGEYSCLSDIVGDKQVAARTIYCVRAYKDYPELFDVLFLAGTVPAEQQGFVSHFSLAGVSQQNADAFTRKFMETVKWQ
ncbi:MAG: serine protease [Alishewanella sp.]|nr:serine protease [Alishewanella sp.]